MKENKEKKTTERIHIGSLIWERLKQDGRKATWLADEISCTRSHQQAGRRRESLTLK